MFFATNLHRNRLKPNRSQSFEAANLHRIESDEYAQHVFLGRYPPKALRIALVIPYDSYVALVTIPLNLSCAYMPAKCPTKHSKLSGARVDGRREAQGVDRQ